MCQSPLRRGTHFYEKRRIRRCERSLTVSIPFTSGNSFLPYRVFQLEAEILKSVNPLHVGELISTIFCMCSNIHLCIVSIPFTSGNSFLPNLFQKLFVHRISACQSPSRRGTHFYNTKIFLTLPKNMVSIPFTSGNSFLQKAAEKKAEEAEVVSIPFTSGNSFLR